MIQTVGINGQNDSNRLKGVSDLHLTFEDIISDEEILQMLDTSSIVLLLQHHIPLNTFQPFSN